jgi:AcrR family transcriptional regulator
MGRPTRRDEILDAVARVIHRDGAAAVTLDAVAAEAGVSKGGLLYHFPAKDDLVRGLVDRMVGRFDARVAHALAGGQRSYLEAYVVASIDDDDVATAAALVAAVALSPSLLDPLRARYAEWSRDLAASGVDPTTVLLTRLALDGLWFADVLALDPPTPAARQALARALIALSRRDPTETPPAARSAPRPAAKSAKSPTKAKPPARSGTTPATAPKPRRTSTTKRPRAPKEST